MWSVHSLAVLVVACTLVAGWRLFAAVRRRNLRRREADTLLRTGVRVHPQSALLIWRAAQLTAPSNRRVLARSLQRVVRDLERRRPAVSPVPLNRAAVAPHAGLVHLLAARLADLPTQVAPRGMVLVEDLITDGLASPLYIGGRESEVRPVLEACLDALDGTPPVGEVPSATERRRAA
jgi:hypothetical protein